MKQRRLIPPEWSTMSGPLANALGAWCNEYGAPTVSVLVDLLEDATRADTSLLPDIAARLIGDGDRPAFPIRRIVAILLHLSDDNISSVVWALGLCPRLRYPAFVECIDALNELMPDWSDSPRAAVVNVLRTQSEHLTPESTLALFALLDPAEPGYRAELNSVGTKIHYHDYVDSPESHETGFAMQTFFEDADALRRMVAAADDITIAAKKTAVRHFMDACMRRACSNTTYATLTIKAELTVLSRRLEIASACAAFFDEYKFS